MTAGLLQAAQVKKTGKNKLVAGPGRPKGVPNKITSDLRAMILTALNDAGGAAYLQRQANENPAAFLTLLGKTLPKEITGPDGKAIFPSSIKIELVSAKCAGAHGSEGNSEPVRARE